MMNRKLYLIASLFLIILSIGAFSASAQADWGSIDISTDNNGDMMVTVENSEIRVVYKQSSNDWAIAANGRPSSIDEFFVKDLNKDITDGGRFDNHLK